MIASTPVFTPRVDRRTKLGRTDIEVCRIGIGCGNQLSSRDLEYAVSRGISYIFTSSDFHAVTYSRNWPAIRRLTRGRKRDDLTIVGCSYVCDPEKLAGVVIDQLLAWKLDHLDVFQWGWVTRANDPVHLLASAHEAFRSPRYTDSAVAAMVRTATQVRRELQARGYVRYLGISTHDRTIARDILDEPNLDVLMLRYNAAHRGAESDVFRYLSPERPAIVAFNTTHDRGGMLSKAPDTLPAGRYVPSVADLYRFALDRPEIDIVLSGPSRREHIDEALSALDSAPIDERRRTYLEKYGELHSGRATVANG